MKITRDTAVQASADRVWKVLGTQFNDAYLWASSINHSEGLGDSGRRCDTELGEFRETIESFDERTRSISYSAKGKKMPFFVKKMQNQWQIEDLGNNQSLIKMEMSVKLSFPFNILMSIPMRLQLSGVVKKVHEELKFFIEHNGLAHPRKKEAQAAYSKRLAMAGSKA